MREARRRAYAIDCRIWYSVVSSKMNQLHSFTCAQVGNPNTPCCVPAGTVEDGGVGGVCSGGCGGVIRGEISGSGCCGVRWWGDVVRVVAAGQQWCGWSRWWSDCGDGCDGEAAVVKVATVGVVAAADQTMALQPHSSKVKIQDPMLDHQDKYMMKAQVHAPKSSAISDVQPLPQRIHYCQIYQVVTHMLRGRLLASFQDHEHEGGDKRSQGSMRFKDNDIKIKIQDHNMQMISQRNSQEQGSKIQERFI
nr:hypothetical protein [Tanacetum cinerariifolium]